MKRTKTPAAKIFENILFLAEVFGDQPDKDVPRWPVLEMARCFDLVPMAVKRGRPPRQKHWALWN